MLGHKHYRTAMKSSTPVPSQSFLSAGSRRPWVIRPTQQGLITVPLCCALPPSAHGQDSKVHMSQSPRIYNATEGNCKFGFIAPCKSLLGIIYVISRVLGFAGRAPFGMGNTVRQSIQKYSWLFIWSILTHITSFDSLLIWSNLTLTIRCSPQDTKRCSSDRY